MSIKLEHINYVYSEGTAYEKHALKDVSLEIPHGEFVGIIGHTGSGKSTLIQHLNGLIKATSGALYYNGENIYGENYNLRELRNQVGLVFQYPEHQLFEVSVLAMRPKVLVLDEPTAGLDPKGRDEILDQIAYLHEKADMTVILVSHSMEDIAKYVDRIIVMNKGSVMFNDVPKKVFAHYKELESVGLAAPQVTYIMHALKEKGMDVPTDATTIEEAADGIMKALKKERAAK